MARRIIRRSFSRLGGVPSGQRRKTEWGSSADVTAFAGLAAATTVLDQAFTAAQLTVVAPGTVIRTVGYIAVQSDQVAATERPFGAMGFAVVSEQARAAGVASLPAPINNEESDLWFVHQQFAASFRFVTAAGFSEELKIFEFDSRAQRKFVDGEAIVVVVENASATFAMNYVLKFRILFKLH